MRQWRASLARSKPNSSTTANTQIAMARGATCSLISKAITIVRGSTPQSATSPHNRQRQKLHNPVSTFPGEGHPWLAGPTPETSPGCGSAALKGHVIWPRAEEGVVVLSRAQLSMLLEGDRLADAATDL